MYNIYTKGRLFKSESIFYLWLYIRIKMGIFDMDREEIIQILKEFKEKNIHGYNIKRLGIFGSVAKNKTKETSDIDIVVELAKQDLFEQIGIKQDIEEKLHRRVDLVSYRKKMNLFLKKRIDEEAVYV